MGNTTTKYAAVGLAAGCALILTGCGFRVSLDTALAEEERSDAYSGATALELRNRDGATTVVGADVEEITLERVLRYTGDTPPEERVAEEGPTLAVTAGGCGGSVVTVGINQCAIDYTVTVPSGTAVTVDSGDGPVTVENAGEGAAVVIEAGDGAIAVSGSAARVEATTTDGAVTLTDITAETVVARALDGSVEVSTTGEVETLDASTGDGSITITAGSGFDALTAKAGDGSITVLTPSGGGPYTLSTSTVDGRVRVDVPESDDAPSTIDLTTIDGSIEVRES
ncbi:DUF4097 family beta strand repeat-containing protein [Nocardiopsis ansamitocini]|uniref:Lipoprotein n=1 Tax=Nocardiopsis ansamitocini TaxID=1670832 RepID=A0A9W6P9B4_9ACTN|nr:DUF4097 family beta strand repeat-containing protein [Nocardiopsis ansamitocini]GLU49357.1 lipoprotein [Nocardiopsis ansamitocini]